MVKPENLKVMRFAQLAVGDLFIYDFPGGASAALKVEDPQRDGEKSLLVLGPNFPYGAARPLLINEERISVLSFAKNFVIRLPVGPESWVLNEHPPEALNLMVDGEGDVYFRIDGHRSVMFVDMKNGKLCSAPGVGSVAYAKSWKIEAITEAGNFQVITQSVSLDENVA